MVIKTISTILTLAVLATSLVGSTCFADEVKNDTDSYVQEPDRRDQYKLKQQKIGRVAKLAGCVAAGTAAVVGTTVAGLKLFEEELPESIKKWLPVLSNKDKALQPTEDDVNQAKEDQSSLLNQPADVKDDDAIQLGLSDNIMHQTNATISVPTISAKKFENEEPVAVESNAKVPKVITSGTMEQSIEIPKDDIVQKATENNSVDYRHNSSQKGMSDKRIPWSTSFLLSDDKQKNKAEFKNEEPVTAESNAKAPEVATPKFTGQGTEISEPVLPEFVEENGSTDEFEETQVTETKSNKGMFSKAIDMVCDHPIATTAVAAIAIAAVGWLAYAFWPAAMIGFASARREVKEGITRFFNGAGAPAQMPPRGPQMPQRPFGSPCAVASTVASVAVTAELFPKIINREEKREEERTDDEELRASDDSEIQLEQTQPAPFEDDVNPELVNVNEVTHTAPILQPMHPGINQLMFNTTPPTLASANDAHAQQSVVLRPDDVTTSVPPLTQPLLTITGDTLHSEAPTAQSDETSTDYEDNGETLPQSSDSSNGNSSSTLSSETTTAFSTASELQPEQPQLAPVEDGVNPESANDVPAQQPVVLRPDDVTASVSPLTPSLLPTTNDTLHSEAPTAQSDETSTDYEDNGEILSRLFNSNDDYNSSTSSETTTAFSTASESQLNQQPVSVEGSGATETNESPMPLSSAHPLDHEMVQNLIELQNVRDALPEEVREGYDLVSRYYEDNMTDFENEISNLIQNQNNTNAVVNLTTKIFEGISQNDGRKVYLIMPKILNFIQYCLKKFSDL